VTDTIEVDPKEILDQPNQKLDRLDTKFKQKITHFDESLTRSLKKLISG